MRTKTLKPRRMKKWPAALEPLEFQSVALRRVDSKRLILGRPNNQCPGLHRFFGLLRQRMKHGDGFDGPGLAEADKKERRFSMGAA